MSNPTEIKPVFSAGNGTISYTFAPLAFSNGTRFIGASLGYNKIQLLDTSNPWNWKLIQEIQLANGTYPHAFGAAKAGRLLALSGYYIDQKYGGSFGEGACLAGLGQAPGSQPECAGAARTGRSAECIACDAWGLQATPRSAPCASSAPARSSSSMSVSAASPWRAQHGAVNKC